MTPEPSPSPLLSAASLLRTEIDVIPWPDPVLDVVGYDPRSPYVERFWLGILGPTTTLLLRRIASDLDEYPEGFRLNLDDTARALGIAVQSRHSPFARALTRLVSFAMARWDDDVLAVRRRLPPLARRQVERLPSGLQAAHRAWTTTQLDEAQAEHVARRARRLALSLFELGEDLEATERQLHRWRFPPQVCRDAAAWAAQRHQDAAADVEADTAADTDGPHADDAPGRAGAPASRPTATRRRAAGTALPEAASA